MPTFMRETSGKNMRLLRVLTVNFALTGLVFIGAELYVARSPGVHGVVGQETRYPVRNWGDGVEALLGTTKPLNVPKDLQTRTPDELSEIDKGRLFKTGLEGFFDSPITGRAGVRRVTGRIRDSDVRAFDVEYRMNRLGNREVVDDDRDGRARKRFVAAVGCSITFGEAVDHGQDYPSQLAQKLGPDWRVYNFGFPGAGPNRILTETVMSPSSYGDSVWESEGVFIWLYIPDHMVRFFCPWLCYSDQYSWVRAMDEWILRDGSFVNRGPFKQDLGLWRSMAGLVSKSNLVQRLAFKRAARFTQEQYDVFLKSLHELSNRIAAQKIRKKYLILFAGHDADEIGPIARGQGFEVIEFFQVVHYFGLHEKNVPLDGHPAPEVYLYLAEVLKRRLERDFPESFRKADRLRLKAQRSQ